MELFLEFDSISQQLWIKNKSNNTKDQIANVIGHFPFILEFEVAMGRLWNSWRI